VNTKKIAFPTDDGETISRHLGEARFYLVAMVDEDGEANFERRGKPRRAHEQSGRERQQDGRHAGGGPTLFAPIVDCQALISGGMGDSAYRHATSQGLEVILPADEKIMVALEGYLAGTLVSDMRRVHKHPSSTEDTGEPLA
jgi:predicted Fe-Mo cluster-binding NifX family protein